MYNYDILVKLTVGSVYNFNNEDGSLCVVGDVIKFSRTAHNYENALKSIKSTLNFCNVKYEIL